MAVKHNNWMKTLTAVFNALATLFGAIKIEKKTDNDESPVNATSYIGEQYKRVLHSPRPNFTALASLFGNLKLKTNGTEENGNSLNEPSPEE